MGKGNQEQETFPARGNLPLSKPAHALKHQDVITELEANERDGLSSGAAKERLDRYGKNDLGESGGVNAPKILLRQIANAMTLVMHPFPSLAR